VVGDPAVAGVGELVADAGERERVGEGVVDRPGVDLADAVVPAVAGRRAGAVDAVGPAGEELDLTGGGGVEQTAPRSSTWVWPRARGLERGERRGAEGLLDRVDEVDRAVGGERPELAGEGALRGRCGR
jgi:hypothetical protein